MSEPRQYRLHLRSENPSGDWHDDPATPKQMARLRYLGMSPAGMITKGQAGVLIDRTEESPDLSEKLQAWHRDKYRLHPDLYAPEPRTRDDAREWQRKFRSSRIYGLAFRKPTQNQILAVLEALDKRSPEWEHLEFKSREHRFMNELAVSFPDLRKSDCFFPCDIVAGGLTHSTTDAASLSAVKIRDDSRSAARRSDARKGTGAFLKWLIPMCLLIGAIVVVVAFKAWSSRSTPAPSGTAASPAAPPQIVDEEKSSPAPTAPAAQAVAASFPSATATPMHPTTPPLLPAELASQAAQSKRQAMVKYPALAHAESEIAIRFGFRYKHLMEDHSLRLQDPNWPLQLADECAAAAGMRVQTAATPAKSSLR